MRIQFTILLFSFQLLLAIAGTPDQYQADSEERDDMEKDIDEMKGIKQPQKELMYETSQAVVHEPDPDNPSRESQHIKLPDSPPFYHENKISAHVKISTDQSKIVNNHPDAKLEPLKKEHPPREMEEKEKLKGNQNGGNLMFEEAESEDESLIDQMLRLSEKLKARVKKDVSVEMKQSKKTVLDEVYFLMEDSEEASGPKETDSVDVDQVDNIDSVHVQDTPDTAAMNKQASEEFYIVENDNIGIDKKPEEKHIVTETVTEQIRKLADKVLESETLLDSIAEHSDESEESFNNDGKSKNILDTYGTKDYVDTSVDQQNIIAENMHSEKEPMSKDLYGFPNKDTGDLIFEEAEHEDESLTGQILRLSSKIKANLDKEVSHEMDELKKTPEEEIDFMKEDFRKGALDSQEESEINDVKRNKEESDPNSVTVSDLLDHNKNLVNVKDQTVLSEKKVDFLESENPLKLDIKNEGLEERSQEPVTEQIKKLAQQILEKENSGDRMEEKENSMYPYNNLEKKVLDSDGKSAVVYSSLSVSMDKTHPPKNNIEPSQTISPVRVERTYSYSMLSADESIRSATPTVKENKDSSIDSTIQSSSPLLQIIPTQSTENMQSSKTLSDSEIHDKTNAEVISSPIQMHEEADSVEDETPDTSVQSQMNKEEVTEEKVFKTVHKIQHPIESSSSDLQIQELNSATPSDTSFSSEAIIESQHTVTGNVEDTRKLKRGIAGTLTREKIHTLEGDPNIQTKTIHTPLKQEGNGSKASD